MLFWSIFVTMICRTVPEKHPHQEPVVARFCPRIGLSLLPIGKKVFIILDFNLTIPVVKSNSMESQCMLQTMTITPLTMLESLLSTLKKSSFILIMVLTTVFQMTFVFYGFQLYRNKSWDFKQIQNEDLHVNF